MRVPSTLRWSLLALAGLAVTIAVAFAASDLASERIGLASEPIRAGESLAPAVGRSGRPGDREPSRPARSVEDDPGTAPVTTTPAPTQTTAPAPVQTTTPTPSAQTTEPSVAGEPTESASGGGEDGDEDEDD